MTPPRPTPPPAAEEQGRYALWLGRSTQLGLVVLVLTFFSYALGFMSPLIPVEQLPGLWGLSADDFLARTGSPRGWGWLELIHHADLTGLLGIAILAGCSLLCLAMVLPIYLKRGERAYALICALEIAVLLLASSGLVGGGH